MAGKKTSAPEGFLTTVEAAEKLCIAPGTLRKWSSFGGPVCPVKFGTALLWPIDEVSALLTSRKLPTNPKPAPKKAKWTEEEVSAYMKSLGSI